MRLLLSAVLAVALGAGCDSPLLDDAPWASFDPFARPDKYVVVRGDTLFDIARAHHVTVGEIQAWNGLESDLIEVGQVLVIWPGDAAPPPAKASPRPRPAGKTLVVAAMVDARPTVPAVAHERPALVSEAGLLAALDGDVGLSEEMDPELTAAAQRLDDHRSRGGTSSGLSHRSGALSSSGSAEMTSMDRPVAPRLAPGQSSWAASATPARAPGLRKPAAKRCLAGPTDVDGDYGMASGAGLTVDQIGRALDGFIRHTAACIPGGSHGQATITTEITVGCDGRVIEARVDSTGGAPSAVAACVAQTLSYAPFPAHDLPEMTFLYPLTLRF